MRISVDFIAGCLGIALSALVWIVSGSFPIFELKGAGPEFYPRVMAAIFACLSVILLYEGIKSKQIEEKPEVIEPKKMQQLLIILAMVVVYYLTMNLIGYFVTTFIMSASMALVLFGNIEKKNLILALINSTVICVAIYVVFRIMLKAPLPQGLFF